MVSEEQKKSPQDPKLSPKRLNPVDHGQNEDSLFSPGFRSVVAMAGWDEEAILIASLVVEDTPDQELKHKKRSDLHFKTPPSNSRRKRRAQRRSPISIPVVVLDLDEAETAREEGEKKELEPKPAETKEKKTGGDELTEQSSGVSSSISALPCIDKLREELSCAICLEICFEPSTTSCGHSFCKKCLRSAADKCGKRCPKCRQLISNGRSCTINTVLWNTIQLLFPQEVEARKATGALNSREAERRSPERGPYNNVRNHRSGRPSGVPSRDDGVRRRRSEMAGQDEDAALALRLQREEFMEAFRSHEQSRSSLSSARANLRAMASKAINLRIRGRPM